MDQLVGYSSMSMDVATEFPGDSGFAISAAAALVLVSAWVILAGSRFVQGGIVERPERVPQLYGYTVCLVSLFWAVTSAMHLVAGTLTLSDPAVRAELDFGGWEPSVSSFEAFRATYDRSLRMGMPDRDVKLEPTPEPELRRRYEALRADRIERRTFQARRTIITSLLSLLVAVALFAGHWRWLKRRVESTQP